MPADEIQAAIDRANGKRRELEAQQPAARQSAQMLSILPLLAPRRICTGSRSPWGWTATLGRRSKPGYSRGNGSAGRSAWSHWRMAGPNGPLESAGYGAIQGCRDMW